MEIFFDWMLIIVASIIMLLSYKKIVYKANCSIGNYIIIITYVFCVLPIIFNYIVGKPKYETVYWYKSFIEAMENDNVSVIYDVYILSCIVALYFGCCRRKLSSSLQSFNSLTHMVCRSKVLYYVMLLLPVIYITITRTWKYYAIYAISSTRGFTQLNKMGLMTPCMLISTIFFFCRTFKESITGKKMMMLGIYTTAIVWISGKRFMLANILLLFVFYLTSMPLTKKERKRLDTALPILATGLIIFSVFYLSVIRPMTETSTSSIYEMLRIDFGRDDVIKYVINKEIVKGEHILDYYGQSFLSLIASFVPRRLWENKPYPHYMYLTSSILGLNIHNIPAGTTPSLLEMTICNFGYWGFFLAIFILVVLTRWIDKIQDVDSKAIALVLMVVLLTQSMDVYLILIVVIILMRLLINLYGDAR